MTLSHPLWVPRSLPSHPHPAWDLPSPTEAEPWDRAPNWHFDSLPDGVCVGSWNSGTPDPVHIGHLDAVS